MSARAVQIALLWCALGLQTLAPSLSEAASLAVATGSYIGDGTASRPITGLGFTPALVIVSAKDGLPSAAATASMPPGGSKGLGGGAKWHQTAILSLDPDGFTLGTHPAVNGRDTLYHWQAFDAEAGTFEVGSYVGTGVDHDYSLGFRPDYVMIMPEALENASQRFAGISGDATHEFKSSDTKTNRIKALKPDGFRLGTHRSVNQTGAVYHFAAWRGLAGSAAAGTYPGTGVPQSLASPGFKPDIVLARRFGLTSSVVRSASMTGDTTLHIGGEPWIAGGITSLDASGLSVGTQDAVNKKNNTYGYVAFANQSAASISLIELKTLSGAPSTTLTPLDTMFVDVTISEPGGFANVEHIGFELYLSSHRGDDDEPAFDANYSWSRLGAPKWQVDDPIGTTWAIVPELCSIDSVTNSTGPQVVRLAFVTSRIARASSTGQWRIEASATTTSPSATSYFQLNGVDVAQFAALAVADSAGHFSQGAAGASDLPLALPADGEVEVQIVSNVATKLDAIVTDLVGTSSPSDTLRVGSPTPRVRFEGLGGQTGDLDTTWVLNLDGWPANDSESPQSIPISLWIDHPPGLPDQSYRGALTFRATKLPAVTVQIPIQANVASSGLAATSALAEATPDTVTVGTTGQSFSFFVTPSFNPGDTGVDRVIISLPGGYSAPTVTDVRVNGFPVSHSDSSTASQVDARLTSAVIFPSIIRVTFTTDVPTMADLTGATFGTLFDDSQTPGVPPQATTAGNANIFAGNNVLRVVVLPGPPVSVISLPDTAAVLVGDTLRFVATATDTYGNVIIGGTSWSETGGVGAIDNGGLFTAASTGAGQVMALNGTVSDTSFVTVYPSIAVEAGAVTGPAFITRGQSGLQTLLRIENPNAESVQIDSVRWTMTRTVPGDANADFILTPDAANPTTLAPGTSAWLAYDLQVPAPAAPGAVAGDAAVYVTGLTSLQSVIDAGADTTWTTEIQDPPNLVDTPASLTPSQLTRGASGIALSMGITNVGQAAVASATGSELRIVSATDSIVAIVTGTGTPWTFGPVTVPPGFPIGRHPVRLQLVGVDANGAPFSQSTWAADSMDVQDSAQMVTVTASQSPQRLLPGEPPQALLSLQLSTSQPTPTLLQSLTIDNATTGPGSIGQRDAELSPLSLYIDDGDGVFNPGSDTFVAQQAMSGGQAVFGGLSIAIPVGLPRHLLVTGAASLLGRDGDSLDVRLLSAANLTFDRAVTFANAWPVDPSARFPVDGMSATQIVFAQPANVTLFAGTNQNEVLDFVVPPNGYEADTLRRLNVVNGGSAMAGADIERLEAWVDDGDGALDPLIDRRLGVMSFTGDRWELTGIRELVSPTGMRVFVSCDLADLAGEGRTIQLELPSLPDVGLGMTSANDGPIDGPSRPSGSQSISNANRLTLTSQTMQPTPISPGSQGLALLHLSATNTYSVPKTLASITLTNATTGTGTQSERDRDLSSLALRSDGDDDGVLGSESVDPTIATGFFSAGRMTFSGINWTLAPGETRDLFVTGDVALLSAADGDAIEVRIIEPGDVSFSDPTVIASEWPLAAGANRLIDGMVARQVTNFGAPVRTIGAGEGPMLAMDVRIPRNGYRDDVLRGIQLRNLGTATTADLSALELWQDGGNGTFDVGAGDDANLGTLVFLNGTWTSPLLNVALGSTGARMFVSANAATAPADSVTLRLAIPVNGITVDSGNDGPIDSMVASPAPLLISNALLLSDLTVLPSASTVSQTVTVRMDVRNVGPDSILGVAPDALTGSGTATVQWLSGPIPAQLDVAPGGTGSFTWTYRADSAGTFQVANRASGLESGTNTPRSSLVTGSNVHRVFDAAQSVNLFAVESMPFSVSRGQPNVVPLSLTFQNPAGAGASDVRLIGLRLRVVDAAGGGIVPADLLSRIVVSEGADVYLEKTVLETAGDEIDLTLAQPVMIPPGGTSSQVTLSLGIDISATTTVPQFRLLISDANAIVADDATSGTPVLPELQGNSFPVQSGLAQIGAEAVELRIDALPDSAFSVGRGQPSVPLLALQLTNTDASGLAADIRLSRFDVTLVDSTGQTIVSPAEFIHRIRVVGPAQAHLDRIVGVDDAGPIQLTLTSPILLPSNTPVPIRIEADFQDLAPLVRVALVLVDSASVIARDVSSDALVSVSLFPDPIMGGGRQVQSRADSVWVRRLSGIAPTVTVGQTNVHAMTVLLTHPGAATDGAIALESISFECRDQLDNPVSVGAYVDRLTVTIAGQSVGTVANPPASSTVTVTLTGVTLAPTDSLDIEVAFDVEPIAPQGLFKFVIPATGWSAADANLATPVMVEPAPGATWPVESGITSVQPPARELIVSATSMMPATLVGDGLPVVVATATFSNTASTDAGDVLLAHLDLFAGDGTLAALPIGNVAAGFEAWTGGRVWASTTLTTGASSTRLAGTDTLRIEPGLPLTIELRMMPRSDAIAPRGVRIGFDGNAVGVVQPSSALLAVAVRAAPGQSFPFWTQVAQFSAMSLEHSYTNFPNPFAAGRDATQFAFYLPGDARVTLRIWTARGERVRTIADELPYSAGLHQTTAWDGRNGAGVPVQNGVYGAELIVRYTDGTSERLVRKVAVVR